MYKPQILTWEQINNVKQLAQANEDELLKIFEDLKGYNTKLFGNEDWEEFRYFCMGAMLINIE